VHRPPIPTAATLATLPGTLQPTTERFQTAFPWLVKGMCKTNYVNRIGRPEILSDVPVEKLPPVARPRHPNKPSPSGSVAGKFRCEPKARGVELRSQGIGNRESGIEPATPDSHASGGAHCQGPKSMSSG